MLQFGARFIDKLSMNVNMTLEVTIHKGKKKLNYI